jgi:hypothetical protein
MARGASGEGVPGARLLCLLSENRPKFPQVIESVSFFKPYDDQKQRDNSVEQRRQQRDISGRTAGKSHNSKIYQRQFYNIAPYFECIQPNGIVIPAKAECRTTDIGAGLAPRLSGG